MVSPNLRLAPPTYFATSMQILFVDGHTSDDPQDWVLMVASRDFVGTVAMSTIRPAVDQTNWSETIWEGSQPSARDLTNLTWMIGNTERLTKGLPVLAR